MWDAMGPMRDRVGLERALSEIKRLKCASVPQQRTMIQRLSLAEAMVSAALLREESRGAHWRSDFAQRNRLIDGARALHAGWKDRRYATG